MKGFTKDGKFRPTGTKPKSALKKSDVRKRNKYSWSVKLEDSHADNKKKTFDSEQEARDYKYRLQMSNFDNPYDKTVVMYTEEGRNKFSLFGNKKSDQAKASEERIKNEEKTEKILEKQDKVQDKNNEKRAKEIAHHIKFLEKHMEGLEKKPAMFGVNANTQLENIQESRDQKRDLQAELDEINKLLEHPQIRHKQGNRTIGKFTNIGYQDKRTPEAKENQHSIIERKEREKNTVDDNWYDEQIAKVKSHGYMNDEMRNHIKFLESEKQKSGKV